MDISFFSKFDNTEYCELKYLFTEFLSLKEHLIKDEKGNLKATHIVFKYTFTTPSLVRPVAMSNINKLNTGKLSSKLNGQKKEYHTYANKFVSQRNKLTTSPSFFTVTHLLGRQVRSFSNINRKQGIFESDSPVIKDLLNIIITGRINSDTQLRIERYLKDQYRESLSIKQKQELSKDKPINYSSLTGRLSKELHENTEDLLKMIANYKSTTIVKSKTDKVDQKLIQDVVSSSPDDFIVSIMYGRLLRIFSNNNRLNENTYSTNVYVDLGKELIDKYIFNLYLSSLNISEKAKHVLSIRYPLSQ
jgi:hypothetical protein